MHLTNEPNGCATLVAPGLPDLVLAVGKIDRAERRFLHRLAEELGLESGIRDVILDVIPVKNGA